MDLQGGKRKCQVTSRQVQKREKKKKTRHALRDRCRRSSGKNPCREKQEEISSERNSYSCQRTRGGLTNVTGKIARKESPVFVLSTSTSRPNRFTTRARIPESPLNHHPRVSRESHDVPSHSVPFLVHPVTEKSTKAPLRQHASPMSAFTLRVSQ